MVFYASEKEHPRLQKRTYEADEALAGLFVKFFWLLFEDQERVSSGYPEYLLQRVLIAFTD